MSDQTSTSGRTLRKAALYFTAFVAIAVYFLAGAPAFMNWYKDSLTLSKSSAIRWDREKYGDLYFMTYVHRFKVPLEKMASKTVRTEAGEKENDLYVIGDSFFAQLDSAVIDSAFYRSSLGYYYFPLAEKSMPRPVPMKNNGRKKILLIERTERFLRTEMTDENIVSGYFGFLMPTDEKGRPIPPKMPPTTDGKEMPPPPPMMPAPPGALAVPGIPLPPSPPSPPPGFGAKLKQAIKLNMSIRTLNANLETLFFGPGIFTPIKEMKAEINYTFFNRVNTSTVLSSDRTHLFYAESVNPLDNNSAFKPITDQQVDTIAQNLNRIGDWYKTLGFDEVVFSFIPNSVTITDPGLGTYNNIINRVEGKLKFPYIDAYNTFKNYPDKQSIYRPADTHWTATGFALWVNEMNKWLKNYSDQKRN